jgi:hypothetical protein
MQTYIVDFDLYCQGCQQDKTTKSFKVCRQQHLHCTIITCLSCLHSKTMELAPSSHIPSSLRPSSPAHTNSSSATRVETTFFNFLKKADNLPCLMASDIGFGSDFSDSPKIPLSPVDEVTNSLAVREGLLHSPSHHRKYDFPSSPCHGKPGRMRESLLHSPSPHGIHRIASPRVKHHMVCIPY